MQKGEDLLYTAVAGKLKARKVNRKEILVGISWKSFVWVAQKNFFLKKK